MRNFIFVCGLTALLASFDVHAQQPRSRADCTQICIQQKDHNWLFRPAHVNRLLKLQERKKAAKSPAEIAQVEKEEADELALYADKVQETCEEICRNNPA